MTKKPVWIYFILAFLFFAIGTAFFPHFRVWPFAPFLVVLYHRGNFLSALWGSFFSGLFMDLLSSQFPFGLLALSHSFTTLFLYKQKRHFFEDRTVSFSVYTAFISSSLSFFLIFFSSLSEKQIPLSPSFFFSDLIMMPFLDAFYAFIWFTVPCRLYTYARAYLKLRKPSVEEDL